MEKENVLEIEFKEVFDKIAVRIKYQNEEILPRGEFEDTELDIYSKGYFDKSNISNNIYIRGIEKDLDDRIILLSKEEFEELDIRFKNLNEKYGIPKRWRAEKYKKYFYIGETGLVRVDKDNFSYGDDMLYNLGNYFKTKEEAQKVKEELDKFWAKVRAGKIGGNKDVEV